MEFQQNPKKWAKISRKFPGRTQHQIKNRYFAILAKECGFSRQNLRDFTKRNCLNEACGLALSQMEAKNTKNNNSWFLENNNNNNDYEENSRNEEHFSWDESKFQDFLNFKTDEEIFSLLEKGESSNYNL